MSDKMPPDNARQTLQADIRPTTRPILGYLRVTVYFLAGSFSSLFCLDVSDYLLNGQSVVGSLGNQLLAGQESPLITMLQYWRSQCVFITAAGSWLYLSFNLIKLKNCRESLVKLQRWTDKTDGRSCLSRHIPQVAVVPLLVILVVACAETYRFFQTVFPDMDSTRMDGWEPTPYSWFTCPAIVFDVWFGIVILISELSLHVLYAGFVYMTSLLVATCRTHNRMLEKTVSHVTEGRFDRRVRLCLTFGDCLDQLIQDSSQIASVLEELDSAVSGLICIFLAGNGILLASRVSRCFIATAFTNVMAYLEFVITWMSAVTAIFIVFGICGTLSCAVKSVRNWQDLVDVWQTHYRRGGSPNKKEEEKLSAILCRVCERPRTLTVAGTVYVTRSFGATLLGGFAGFICFCIERSESYEDNQSIRLVNSVNCSVS